MGAGDERRRRRSSERRRAGAGRRRVGLADVERRRSSASSRPTRRGRPRARPGRRGCAAGRDGVASASDSGVSGRAAPLGAMAAGDEERVREAEAGEVLDVAARHDADRGAAGQIDEGVEHAGQQRGVGGVGDDRREHAVDVEGGEQRAAEGGDLVGDGHRIVEDDRARVTPRSSVAADAPP